MTTFYLIRHGQTDWNVARKVMGRTDVPLNAVGEGQARDLAEAMKGFPLDGILSSPQLRARQTAEALGRVHGVPVAADPALAEVNFTGWVGVGLDTLLKDPEYHRFLNDPYASGPGFSESTVAVRQRVSERMERLAAEKPDGTFALVSHADPIRAAVSFALGGPVEEFRRIRIANASLSVVLREDGNWRLTLLNFRRDPDLLAKL
jgi:broad specificity phosphatase PhoE